MGADVLVHAEAISSKLVQGVEIRRERSSGVSFALGVVVSALCHPALEGQDMVCRLQHAMSDGAVPCCWP